MGKKTICVDSTLGTQFELQWDIERMDRVRNRVKTHSYRVVRFLDCTIGCDLANMRPISNACYDLQ